MRPVCRGPVILRMYSVSNENTLCYTRMHKAMLIAMFGTITKILPNTLKKENLNLSHSPPFLATQSAHPSLGSFGVIGIATCTSILLPRMDFSARYTVLLRYHRQSKKISNDQELIQSDPISCPQNQKGNN